MKKCCDGYWGFDCNECPGGANNPCNKRGKCLPDGTCKCRSLFVGRTCEHCYYEDTYGSDCAQPCRCTHGQCDSGPLGSGRCSCESGYTGVHCDRQIYGCEDLECHNSENQTWKCAEVNGKPTCVCTDGYKYVEDYNECVAIDPCKDGGHNCLGHSVCEYLSPGKFKCVCEPNYSGDGTVCEPINPCQTNGGGCNGTGAECRYLGPNKHECVCLAGYENYMPDVGCSVIDLCLKSHCDRDATCRMDGPVTYKCTCNEGYIGNGTKCYGNILSRLINLNENELKNDLEYVIHLITTLYKEPLTKGGPFTVFVPNDKAFKTMFRNHPEYVKFMENENQALQIFRQHILIGSFNLEDLQSMDRVFTLQGNEARLQVKVQKDVFKYQLRGHATKAKVVMRDIEAFNGMIHIVNNMLTQSPEIEGDPQKSILDIIRKEPAYRKFHMLIESAGLYHLFKKPQITVFAPDNKAWDVFPNGIMLYLMNDQEGRHKLDIILKNHILEGMYGVTRLIAGTFIHSMANTNIKVSVSSSLQIRLDDKANVTQVNIPNQSGVYHHIDGVLVPNTISLLLPSRCDTKKEIDVQGPCFPCGMSRCPMDTDILQHTVKCGPSPFWFRSYIPQHLRVGGGDSCMSICKRTIPVPKCCEGFFGIFCQLCPGAYKNPCFGMGKCSDGISGTGICTCYGNAVGTACEECKENFFGPYCNQTCTCLKGVCNGGRDGDGMCRFNSCAEGYHGKDCDKKLIPCGGDVTLCHANAHCYLDDDGIAWCQCDLGYEGDGDDCVEIDPCAREDRGKCHDQATCTKIGPGANQCECMNGWWGDGFYCVRSIPCNEDTDCHRNGFCNKEPGRIHCKCKEGFTGDGEVCAPFDVCLLNNGGCDPRANCTLLETGGRNCTCPDYAVGDGITCYATIAEKVMHHPDLTLLAKLMKVVDEEDNVLDVINSSNTFFAPNNDAIRIFMEEFNKTKNSTYWEQEENVIWFLNFHTLYKGYTQAQLQALGPIFGIIPTMYDGFSLHIVNASDNSVRIFANHSTFANIIEPDIYTVNGYFHIVDTVLEPFYPTDGLPSVDEVLSARPEYSMFYNALQDSDVLDYVINLDAFTIFVPTNDAMKALNRPISSKRLKYYMLPKLLFTPSIQSNDTADTLLGRRQKVVFEVDGDTVYINNVKIVRSDVLIDGGVLHQLDSLLHPVLNFCSLVSVRVEKGNCVDCNATDLICPDGATIEPPHENCLLPSSTEYGCTSYCLMEREKPECCGGFYGQNCSECPGGPETPCSGKGLCLDGLAGNGTCICHPGFSGMECDKSVRSCAYRNGNCSENALCTDNVSGVTCRCALGDVGDGFTCQSVCDSLDNGGCHPQADCAFNISEEQIQCTCKQGYHGNGTWCIKNIDPCTEKNGGCDLDRAICRSKPPKVTDMVQGDPSCDCMDGFVGNGTLCSTDLMDAITRMPALEYFSNWLQRNTDENITSIVDVLKARWEKSTLFVPVSTDWTTLNLSSLLILDQVIRLSQEQMEENADDAGQWTLVTLGGDFINVTMDDDEQFWANGVKVLDKNIETLNGLLHLTEFPAEIYEPVASQSSANFQTSQIVPYVVVGAIVLLLVVMGVVIYKKRHWKGFYNLMRRFQSGSDSNLSFARLSIQDNDDDSLRGSDARYENPLFREPDVI